jgi:hypothetical protein
VKRRRPRGGRALRDKSGRKAVVAAEREAALRKQLQTLQDAQVGRDGLLRELKTL